MIGPRDVPELGWWVVSGAHLLDMLREVSGGADPDVVYAECYANSTHDYPERRAGE